MSLSFFWKDTGALMGVRADAGLFCWHCNVTLCRQGIDGIHKRGSEWRSSCPRCGRTLPTVTEKTNKPRKKLTLFRTRQPTGVASCWSFTWAQKQPDLRALLRKKCITVNLPNTVLTGAQFKRMLRCECPIHFFEKQESNGMKNRKVTG